MFPDRVLSGMRPTGRMHIGHYHGALKNWVRLQQEYECYFFVADWHALTTNYESPEIMGESVWDMVIDWLASGLDPAQCAIFIQSRVPDHAELTLLLGMITSVGWLERVPTYKEQQQNLSDKDLSTFGFLGYPLMQAADILIYRANLVPVGEDQVSHLELVREIARRFNHIYGRESGFEEKARAAVKKLGAKRAKLYDQLRTQFQQEGIEDALVAARELIDAAQNLNLGDRERLFGYLEGSRKVILPEPQALLTEAPKVPGLDGRKMSKSYNNSIFLREDPASISA
jgi:tryptophanyl-tRNA synthetase